jgi:polyhydroxyalkanoate synthase
MAPSLSPSELAGRVNRDLERTLLRARNGIRYVRGSSRPKVGVTPKDIVWERDKAQLWRYRGRRVQYDPPILIVHSLVSRSYILDLRPGNSAVEFLRDAGFDVFMLDWGVPDALDANNSFATYVDEYVPRAVQAVQRETGCAEVTMAGYCLGGVIAVLYAAGREEAAVRNLLLMATPGDFAEMGPMVAALREGRLNPEELLDETGNVPADVLYSGFFMIAPTTPIAQYATLLENLWNDEFVEGYQAMAQWSRDHVPFPGAVFREVVEKLVRANTLTTGEMRVGHRTIDFTDTSANVLVAMAERDGVVPLAAAEPLTALVGRPERRDQLRLKGGHVTFGTGRQAFKHSLPSLAQWIAAHSDAVAEPRRSSHGDTTARLPGPTGAERVSSPHTGERQDVLQGADRR